MAGPPTDRRTSPWRQIVQPFIDLVHAPRALMGVNVSYFLEGFCYFGVLGYLVMYFNTHVGLTDVQAGPMVGVLTWGITLSMFFFGGLADRWGVRTALVAALFLMLLGRCLLAGGPSFGLGPDGLWSPVHLTAMGGILLVILGYGMYQPAAYAAVRQLTTPRTAGMAYAMLYALMNLGGWLPSFFSPIRNAVGIAGAYWVYVGMTVAGLLLTWSILSRKVAAQAIAAARVARAAETGGAAEAPTPAPAPARRGFSLARWLREHPLANPKFSFFIFCLIPVQTLFAHNWLTLPMYVERAYRESWPWISLNFEPAVNFNPILIFLLVPIVTSLTQRAKVYNMMIIGTFVMAAPTFLLALGPTPFTLVAYLIIMTVGEAMWQPRFLQYAAEIAPEGRTGAYMGVAQFPWFLTKMITSLYSGWFLARYCPEEGPQDTQTMWLIYGLIAISSTVMLLLARNWVGRDFKTKA